MRDKNSITKTYCTTSSNNQTCYFRRDYSYYVNGFCLRCRFCYAELKTRQKSKWYWSELIDRELIFNPDLLYVPITVSRYIEPFKNAFFTANAQKFIKYILEHKGQVIIKTCKEIPESVMEIISPYKDKLMIQLGIFAHDTNLGNNLYKELSPHRPLPTEVYKNAETLVKEGFNVAFSFSPYIIRLNDKDLINVANTADSIGINKIIIKQLFCTDKFRDFLSSRGLNNNIVKLLSQEYKNYTTYNNIDLLESLYYSLSKVKNKNTVFSMCSNKYINSILNNHSNCCLFDNPNGIYNLSINPMWRGKGVKNIIKLKEVL